MSTLADWLRKPDSHILDASVPFVLFAVVMLLLLRQVRLPGWRDIGHVPLLVALTMVYWVHWTLFEYGIVVSDEIAGWVTDLCNDYVPEYGGKPEDEHDGFADWAFPS